MNSSPQILYLDDICRFCLGNKSSDDTIFFTKIEESKKMKFEAISGINVSFFNYFCFFLTILDKHFQLPMDDDYPLNTCGDCSDHIENFFFYKLVSSSVWNKSYSSYFLIFFRNLLIKKQNELFNFLKDNCENNSENLILVDADSELISTQEIVLEDTETEKTGFGERFHDIEPQNKFIEDQLMNENDLEADWSKNEDPKETLRNLSDAETEKIVLMPNMKKYKKTNCASIEDLDSLEPKVVIIDNGDSFYGCPVCSSVFKLSDECRDHFGDHRFDFGPQKCEQCPATFKTARFYKQHIEKSHNGETLVCHICAKVFVDCRRKFRLHVHNHDLTKKYKCSQEGCDKIFRHMQHLIAHTKTHSKEYPYLCTICPARFKNSYNLNVHNRGHTGDFKKCPQCTTNFLTTAALKNHLQRCDGKRKEKKGGRRINYMRNGSESDQKYKCFFDGCGNVFDGKISIQEHLTNVHQMLVTDLTCLVCGEETESSTSLRYHLRVHLGFICPHCNIPLRSEDVLKVHVSQYHQNDENQPNCQVEGCNSKFKRIEHLTSHIKFRHSLDRPFKCDLCPFTAVVRYELNHHMRIHRTVSDIV